MATRVCQCVGHARGHPVAQTDTGGDQAVLKAGDMLGQFGPGQVFTLTVFARHGHHGHGIVATAQQVFGEVGSAGEPLGAGHLRAFEQHRVGLLMEADVEEVDDGLPEIRALVDRPLVQGGVVVDVQVVPLIDEAPKGLHAGLADAFGAGLPERCSDMTLPLLYYSVGEGGSPPAQAKREMGFA